MLSSRFISLSAPLRDFIVASPVLARIAYLQKSLNVSGD
jgi:hypothetical protein